MIILLISVHADYALGEWVGEEVEWGGMIWVADEVVEKFGVDFYEWCEGVS